MVGEHFHKPGEECWSACTAPHLNEEERAEASDAYDNDNADFCTCEMGEMGTIEYMVPGCPTHDAS